MSRALSGSPRLLYLARIVVVSAAYFAAAKLGRELPFIEGIAAPVWPPAGIGLGALLILGPGMWPAIALGSSLAALTGGTPLGFALGAGVGPTLEILTATFLLRRVAAFENSLARVRDVLALVSFGAVLATAVGASVGVLNLCLNGLAPWSHYIRSWWVWWLGDAMGVLVVTPPILVIHSLRGFRLLRKQLLEATALIASLVIVSQIIFSNLFAPETAPRPLAYVPFPLLIWAAFRFGRVGATTATLIVAGSAAWGTAQGLGPFGTESLDETLLFTWAFLSVVAVTTLLLSAVISERESTAAALRESEERLRTMVEYAPEAVVLLDVDTGHFVEANDRAVQLYGVERTKLLEVGPVDLSPPTQPDGRPSEQVARDKIAETVAGGSPTFEWMHRHADGENVLCEVRLVRLLGAGRNLIRGSITNITERKAGEEALRESEERYRSVIAAMVEGIVLQDHDGHIIACNSSAERILGLTAEQMIGRTSTDPRWRAIREDGSPFPDEDHPAMVTLRTGDPQSGVLMGVEKPDATLVWIVINAQPLFRDHESTPYAVASSFADMTAQKAAADQLGFQARVLKNVRDAVAVTDTRGNITYWNAGATEVFGYSEQEMLGKTPVVLDPEGSAEAFEQVLQSVLAGRDYVGEWRGVRKDGTDVWVEAKTSAMHDADSKLLGAIGVAKDVTERKRLEQQLLQSQKMDAIGRLAGGIAHDFNNIITVIRGTAEIVRHSLPPENARRADIEQIESAARRAADLTAQLLAFARKQFVAPKVINLNELVLNMEKMLHRLIGEDVELTTAPAANLWAVKVDPGRLEQVIVNLAVNAREAMPTGGALVIETSNVMLEKGRATLEVPAMAGRHVMLSVRDSGVGMTEETLARVFEPFFTTKGHGDGRGTGLGLATCYGIVKQAGGFIWLESELRVGTTVKIYLPATESHATELPQPRTKEKAPTGSESILLVEDEQLVRDMVVKVLGKQGYSMLAAPSGAEALEMAQGHPGEIDLLLTDVVLPVMSGVEVAKRLRQLRPGLKVLYVSGYTEDSVVRQGVLQDGVAFLPKPFTPRELAQKVRDVLDDAT